MSNVRDRALRIFNIFSDLIGGPATSQDSDGVGIGIPSGPSSSYFMRNSLSREAQIVMPYQSAGLNITIDDLPARDFGDWGEQKGSSSRRQRYMQYEMLVEMMPEVRATLETFADEASSYDPKSHVIQIHCKDKGVKRELEYLYFDALKVDSELHGIFYNACLYGDDFWELKINPENPEMGILGWVKLDPFMMWRIESNKGVLLEFQQSDLGPDYDIVEQDLIKKAAARAGQSANAMEYFYWAGRKASKDGACIRFAPAEMSHFRLGGSRKGFYPYGVSKLATSWRAAYNLKLVQDSMLCYRLCLTGDSRVRTNIGYKEIKDLHVGDSVFSVSDSLEPVETKVSHWVNNGPKPVFKVMSKHIEFRGTSNHPVLVKDGNEIRYVDISDLKIKHHKIFNVPNLNGEDIPITRFFGEKVAKLSESQKACFRNFDYGYGNIAKIARTISMDYGRIMQFLYGKGKCLPLEVALEICEKFNIHGNDLIICNKTEIKSERINIPEFIDENFAMMFGFLIGDGSVSKHYVSFAAGVDEENNKKYQKLLEFYFGNCRFNQDKRCAKGLGHYVSSSATAAKIMRDLGFITGAHLKRIPEWCFRSHPNIRKAFVEGLSEADGCERKTRAGTWFSTIEMCNHDLICDIKEIWSSIGLSSGHIKKRIKPAGRLLPEGRKSSKDHTSWVLTISKIPLPQEENVLSVIEDGVEDVFDITVESDFHNFIVNGTVVHNSRGPERKAYYVDIGSMAGPEVQNYIEAFKQNVKKKKIYNEQTRSIDMDWNPMPIRRNTPVPLLDGRTLTIEKLSQEYQEGKENWVYSVQDSSNGTIVPGKITWCGKNYHCENMIRVWFDDGGHVDTAPEHPYVLRDGSSKRADELVEGDSIASFSGVFDDSFMTTNDFGEVVSVESLENESDDVYCMNVVGPNGENDRHNFAVKTSSQENSYVFVKNSVDDDLFIPVRTGTNTRIETLPGAAGMNDIDDARMFRDIFLISLGMPKGYLDQTVDSVNNKLTLTQQDMRFAKRILAIQKPIASEFRSIGERHLTLTHIPRRLWQDFYITITPSSDFVALNKAELLDSMFNRANIAKSLEFLPESYIKTEILNMSEEDVVKWRQQLEEEKIRRAELDAKVAMITSMGQMEIDRANAINVSLTQAEIEKRQAESGTPPVGEENAPTGQEAPVESPVAPEEVASAFPPEEEVNVGKVKTLSASDKEAQIEDRYL